MFITLEGPDGSGKTTQAGLLIEFLIGQGHDVLHTREPGGTSIGDQIREVLHRLDNTEMHPNAEILLYAASRAQLVAQKIRPHLSAGGIVICDRYADSTLAYQGYGHGLDLTVLRQILDFATGKLKPDLTLYFDISPEMGMERRKSDASSGGDWNRLDAYALDFHRRVYKGYAALIAQEPERWISINAAQAVESVHNAVREAVKRRLDDKTRNSIA